MDENLLLFKIQRLQFSDKPAAEGLLLDFVRKTFSELDVTALELRPQATSLNSFNGFITLADGSRLFFKTHVEQDNVIGEYYNAEMLASAGYPVIQPLYSSTQSGQHLLIYPVIKAPPVFDVARDIETTGAFESDAAAGLMHAQNASDDALLACYRQTLALAAADDAATAPVHQLFWHRITGGRYGRFYGEGTAFSLPHGRFDSDHVLGMRWQINGAEYKQTLRHAIDRAAVLLHPARAELTVIGHGDAHNGNVFALDSGLTYFDPAFAGRHSPLIDLVKPLFHNVFAMWMYFPQQESDRLSITVEPRGDVWHVQHDYALNPLRRMFFESKFERVLRPVVTMLRERDALTADWRERIKLALMCCPLLTMNLTGFPPDIALLGLCFAVEMGLESSGQRSWLDSALDRL